MYSLAAGYPASAITLYAVLAGHGADGGLMGHFLGMCNVVYLLGPSGMVAGEAIIISITGGFLFGLLTASFHWWRRKVNRLPPWDDV